MYTRHMTTSARQRSLVGCILCFTLTACRHELPTADTARRDAPRVDVPPADAPRADVPPADAPRADAPAIRDGRRDALVDAPRDKAAVDKPNKPTDTKLDKKPLDQNKKKDAPPNPCASTSGWTCMSGPSCDDAGVMGGATCKCTAGCSSRSLTISCTSVLSSNAATCDCLEKGTWQKVFTNTITDPSTCSGSCQLLGPLCPPP